MAEDTATASADTANPPAAPPNTDTRDLLIAWAATNVLLFVVLLVVGGSKGALFGGMNAIVSGGVALVLAGKIGSRWGLVYRMHAVQSLTALVSLVPAAIGSFAVVLSPGLRAQCAEVLLTVWVIPVVALVALYLCVWLVLAVVEVTQREIAQTV